MTEQSVMTRGGTRWKADYSPQRSVDVKPSERLEEPSPSRTASSRSLRQAKDPKDFGGDYDAIRAELQKGDGWGAGYSMASVLNTVSNNSFGEWSHATCMDGAVHQLHSMPTTPHFRLAHSSAPHGDDVADDGSDGVAARSTEVARGQSVHLLRKYIGAHGRAGKAGKGLYKSIMDNVEGRRRALSNVRTDRNEAKRQAAQHFGITEIAGLGDYWRERGHSEQEAGALTTRHIAESSCAGIGRENGESMSGSGAGVDSGLGFRP